MNRSLVEEQLEQVLFEFEKCWVENKTPVIDEFLPARTSQNFLEVLTELVRSDMEFKMDRGHEFAAKQYFSKYPELVQNLNAKKAVVFEEYRLRIGRDEKISPDVLCRQYDIDSTGWPLLQSNSRAKSPRQNSSRVKSTQRKRIVFPKIGESFHNFELVGQLGEGAFGKVFLAQQADLAERLVVLKFTSTITDEHRLLARLQHTNIVPIHSVHRAGDLQAICMPLLGVATLQDVLRHCGQTAAGRYSIQSNALVRTVTQEREETVAETIDSDIDAHRFRSRQKSIPESLPSQSQKSLKQFAANFIQQTAEGLGFAHQKGIVHGDLKPANVLLDDDGKAVILDFHLGYSKQDNIGQHIGGTLPYMAPEHLRSLSRNEIELDPTTDIYSAGVMLHEILTGRFPYGANFSGDEFLLDELAKEKDVPFKVAPTDRATIGEDLSAIVESCLDPNPAKRFQNGHELACELDRYLNFQSLKHATNGSPKNRIQKWAKRNPRLSSGSTIFAVCSIMIAAMAMAFLIVNSKLNTFDAFRQHESRIELAQSILPSFTVSDGSHDSSYFQEAIEKADRVVKQNGWSGRDELAKQKHFGRLESDDAAVEMATAAELQFWIAEACQQVARSTATEKYLQDAIRHNRSADSFWPQSRSKQCLTIQHQNIQSRLDKETPASFAVEEISLSNNRKDRILTAYLLRASDAEELFEKLVEEETDDFLTWLLLGNVCIKQEKFEKAQACYTVCRSIDPNSSLPVLYRGLAKLEQRNVESALADFELAERLSPDDVTITLNFALALIRKRDFKAAKTKLDHAIELGAQQTRVWQLRSKVRKVLGDEDGAKADLELFLSKDPIDEKSCVARGYLKIKNDPQAAIRDFERALEFNPRSVIAHNNIAHVYSEVLGNTEQAINSMDKAVELDGSNAKMLAGRGVLLARTGQRDAALKDAQTALRLDRSPDTLYRVAGIFAQTSKIDPADKQRAISLFSRAAYQDPSLVLRMLKDDPDIMPLSEDTAFSTIVEAIKKLQNAWVKNSQK